MKSATEIYQAARNVDGKWHSSVTYLTTLRITILFLGYAWRDYRDAFIAEFGSGRSILFDDREQSITILT